MSNNINKDWEELDSNLYMCYDLLVQISVDRVLATHGEGVSLISASGEMIVTYDLICIPEYIDEEYMIDDMTAEYSMARDLLLAYENNRVGVIDYDGDIVVPIEYSSIVFDSPNSISTLPYIE